MNEKLISGYAAYTTAEEYGAAATGNAPASVESLSWAISAAVSGAVVGASVSLSVQHGC